MKKALTGAAEDDGAGFAHGGAGEVDEAVLPDHDLLDQLAPPQLHRARVLKRARDLPACTRKNMTKCCMICCMSKASS